MTRKTTTIAIIFAFFVYAYCAIIDLCVAATLPESFIHKNEEIEKEKKRNRESKPPTHQPSKDSEKKTEHKNVIRAPRGLVDDNQSVESK